MTLPARAEPLASPLDGLPLCDPSEIERATGFVRTVRSLVTVPLTTLGLLATLAALSMGNLLAAALAGAATLGVVFSLVRDTRLSVALDRLRSGRLEEAEQGMNTLVQPHVSPDRQRGRAEAYLAAIAWARGDHAAALRWTQTRGSTLERVGAAEDEVFLNEASTILLLALSGKLDEAEAVMAELGPTPSGERWARAEAAARLSVAFGRDDLESVRLHLDRWSDLVTTGTPLISAWMTWALDHAQRPEAARDAAACARTDPAAIARHVPRLADWLSRFETARLGYRR